MNQKYDLAVYIGRFQPLHLGHMFAIKRGLSHADRVLVLMGDTGGPRSIKNPWTFEERKTMLQKSLPTATGWTADDVAPEVLIDTITDVPHNDQLWIAQVQAVVAKHAKVIGAKRIALIGHEKDGSSFYLKYFPQWKFVDTGYEELEGQFERRIDATKIREFIFEDHIQYTVGLLGREVREYILYLREQNPEVMEELTYEYNAIKKYRASWASAPFPPIFVTTDAVVIQSGHVLLVKRGQRPGKGLWALPGGFIDQTESIEDCAIRELIEETEIKLQPEVLRRCIAHVEVFDRAGGVSTADRGRIITHVHLFKLQDNKGLPKVSGADDAAEARWVPLSEVDPRQMFSDHYHLLQSTLGKL